jgi:hypothetical protein
MVLRTSVLPIRSHTRMLSVYLSDPFPFVAGPRNNLYRNAKPVTSP